MKLAQFLKAGACALGLVLTLTSGVVGAQPAATSAPATGITNEAVAIVPATKTGRWF